MIGPAQRIARLALILVPAVAVSAAQSSRDGQRSVAAGSGSITGTVVAGGGVRSPIRRAELTLLRAGLGESRTTATDDQGRFLFTELSAGVYTLSASKGGFVGVAYGASRPGLPGSPIPLGEGQQFTAAPISMVRGSVITGRLTSKGQALRGATVEAVQFQVIDGERRRRTFTGATGRSVTDAQGAYRIHSLAPGEYLVSVTAPSMFVGGEIHELTPAEVQWAHQRMRSGGRGTVAPAPPGTRLPPSEVLAPGRPFTFAPTFFPGTADAAAAVVVTLGAGEERGGVDFPILSVPTAEISGIVVGLDGQPMGGVDVGRTSRTPNHILLMYGLDRAMQTDAEGRFVRSAVPPGDYTIVARGVRKGEALVGLLDVTLNGEDIRGARVQMQRGSSVSGRVAFGAASPAASSGLTRIQTRLLSPTGGAPPINPGSAVVTPDATFKIAGVAPGRYLMTATLPPSSPPSRWVLESIRAAGRNVLDHPLEIRSGEDVPDVVITYSDRPTMLSGRLVDGQGAPTPQFFVLVYPLDRSLWRSGSRWIRSARAGVDGSFEIAGLPAGEYFLCALTEVDADQQYDVAYLEQFVSGSIKITLAPGQRRVQDLRVGGL